MFRHGIFKTRITVGKRIDTFIVTFTEMFFFLFLEIVLFILVTYLHWLTTQIGEYLYQAICLHWMHTQSGESGEYLY